MTKGLYIKLKKGEIMIFRSKREFINFIGNRCTTEKKTIPCEMFSMFAKYYKMSFV